MAIKWLIDASYFVAAILFILGLKGMSSPVSARKGIVWAGVGMVLATVVTFLTPGMGNMLLMVIAIGLGGVLAWVSGKRVAMTDMPQMVAIYNGMGGGAAAAIAAVEFARGEMHGTVVTLLATLGALIGAVSFSGSVVAWAKLQGVMNKAFRLPAQNAVNVVLALDVLLAEAGVPYEKIFDLEEINADFAQADVALVIGANDVVNPSARTDKSSPIYGMPILNADMAQNVIVVKRGKGTGYSGIENALFYKDNTRLLYGSAQQAIGEVIQHVKAMSV